MKVLLVEDNERITASIKKGLEQETFAVDVAADGEAGYDLASTEEYDVIVLDWMLPLKDGFEVCKELRKNGIVVPVLMLTAKDDIESRVDGLNAGADDYLVKPFEFEELLARIRALSRRPKNQLASELVYQDLFVDSLKKVVRRGPNSIILSKKEFSLLEFLMRNQGQLLTKDQIIQNVWNFDANVLPNTVEVYIGYLRNKIDKPFKNKPPLIQTVRGFGYKLGES